MMRMRLLVLAVWIAMMVPTAVWAAPWSILGSVTIDGSNNGGSGVFGSINGVAVTIPLPPATGTAGFTNDLVNNDILFIEFVLDAGSADVDQFGLSGPGATPIGAAFYPGSGTQDPNDSDESAVLVQGTQGIFNFEHLADLLGNLEAGESSGILAVSFVLGDLPPAGIGPFGTLSDTVSFSVGSGDDFSINGTPIAPIVPIPEPVPAFGPFGIATLLSLLGLVGWRRLRV